MHPAYVSFLFTKCADLYVYSTMNDKNYKSVTAHFNRFSEETVHIRPS